MYRPDGDSPWLMIGTFLVAGVMIFAVLGDDPPAPMAFAPGYYCVNQPDGVRVYAPGHVDQGRAVVIWADTGRLHHIDTEQLVACQWEET